MSVPPHDKPPIALAVEWVSRITTVALEMVLPGIFGGWLDRRWGTRYLALLGLAIGFAVGMWHLLRMTGSIGTPGGKTPGGNQRPKTDQDQRRAQDGEDEQS